MSRLVRAPSPLLTPFIALLWHQQVLPGQFGPELVVPSGSAELVIELGPAAAVATTGTVCGPHSTPFRLARPHVAHALVGVHFHPGGLWPFTGVPGRRLVPASTLHNLIVTLEDLWGGAALLVHERLMQAASAHDRLQIMEHELQRRLLPTTGQHPAVSRAVALLQRARSHRPVAMVADRLGYSTRRLQQQFTDAVGVSPKTFQRLSRFHTVLELIHNRPGLAWADLALGQGYVDQAHLVNDFRTFTSLSPTAYLRQRTAQRGHLREPTRDAET